MDKQKGLKIFFPNLDGLRFISFLSVFLFHSFGSDDKEILSTTTYKVLKIDLLYNGVLGVNFFFVLSGFLITYLLLLEIRNYGGIKISNFYVRRLLRIWPLYFLCVLFGFFLFPYLKSLFGEVPNESASIEYYIFFISNIDIIRHGIPDSSNLSILWSVAVEEQFYFFWPLILVIFPRKKYLYVFIILIFLSFLFRYFNSFDYLNLTLHSFSCFSDMVIGGFFAYLAVNSDTFLRKISIAPKYIWVLLYTLVFFFFFFSKYIFRENALLIAFERLFISILFAFVILEQCFGANSFFKMSNFKLFTKLGTYTYGLYCLHPIAILISNKSLEYFGLNNTISGVIFLETPISFVITVLLAFISYHYFERYFLILKSKFARITKF